MEGGLAEETTEDPNRSAATRVGASPQPFQDLKLLITQRLLLFNKDKGPG